jgi:hypothetical protein
MKYACLFCCVVSIAALSCINPDGPGYITEVLFDDLYIDAFME